jgi:hypothetical protein
MGELSDSEKLEFKRNGFLPVNSAVDRDLTETARERIWESIPEGRADPSSLVGEGVLKEPAESAQISLKFPEEDRIVAGAEPPTTGTSTATASTSEKRGRSAAGGP